MNIILLVFIYYLKKFTDKKLMQKHLKTRRNTYFFPFILLSSHHNSVIRIGNIPEFYKCIKNVDNLYSMHDCYSVLIDLPLP